MNWATACEAYRKAAPKKIPETDAIFERLKQVNAQADADEGVLRLSLDAKASVRIGDYSRGGQTRVIVKASDHDFQAQMKLTPFGIFLPQHDRLYLYFTTSKLTSDFMVDCLLDCCHQLQPDFPYTTSLLVNLDNGPENHSRRTQFMLRMTQLADHFQWTVDLAYYPPYHSKYNRIERCWGILENHWNGALLNSIETALHWARTMTWRGVQPLVQLLDRVYDTGVRLTKSAFRPIASRLLRSTQLPKWSLVINPQHVR